MRHHSITELSLIRAIRSKFAARTSDLSLGIGDDAAVICPDRKTLLVTTDMMMEGIHFDRSCATLFQVGYKLISVNVSDIFAMGGSPRFVLLNLAVGRRNGAGEIKALIKGVQAALDTYGVIVIGGDLSSSRSGIAAAATVIGYVQKPVSRSGARPGDSVYVSGTLGDSSCGLSLLRIRKKPLPIESGKTLNKPLPWTIMGPLLRRHLMPVVRSPGPLAKRATAMIDVSDGLFIDLGRLCEESRVGARIYEELIPFSPELRRAAGFLGKDLLGFAAGGEDYVQLFTTRPGCRVRAFRIGEITDSGRVLVDPSGREKKFPAGGYQHWL